MIRPSASIEIEMIAELLEQDSVTGDVRSLIPLQFYMSAYDRLGGGTALHWAVRMEDPAMVACILAEGEADVNAKDKLWKATALHWQYGSET